MEVQLGPLGVEKGVEDEVEHNNIDELLGGDEEYRGSSDLDSCYDDSEDEDWEHRTTRRLVHHNPDCELPVFGIGMVFKNAKEFRLALGKYSVKRGAKLKWKPNEVSKVRVKCIGGNDCAWELFASIETSTNNFTVKTYYPKHSCTKTNKNKRCNSKFIAEYFSEKISDTTYIKLWRLQELVK
ncbi:hypothetical protein M5689_000891 [Euphorbia peplus]|nr:hypothetical protein M5689_000891 [Euphorbia peplus]